MTTCLTPEKAAERLTLYRRGLGDRSIAKIQGCGGYAITRWRQRHGLPPNVARSKHCPISEKDRIADYRSGLNDRQLAQRWGMNAENVARWRRRRGLSTNCPSVLNLSDEARAARMLLYSFGYSDARIAREQCVTRGVIKNWRKRMGLKPNMPPGRPRGDLSRRQRRRKGESGLLDRIKNALPQYLSPADRDDAASDLFLAVMSGAIPIEEIERRAKTFGNKVVDQYASKFGPRSLDAEIGDDGDGFSMLDMLRDDSHSSWLEEMGATAW